MATVDPEKRSAVGAQIDSYAMEFPDEFRWASSPLAPALLYRLFATIDASCRPVPRSGPLQANYLVDRKAYPQPGRFVVKLNEVGQQDAKVEPIVDPPASKAVDDEVAPNQQAAG